MNETKKVGLDKELPQKLLFIGFLLLILLFPLPQFVSPGDESSVWNQVNTLWILAVYFLFAVLLEVVVGRAIPNIKKVPFTWWCIAGLFLAGLISLTQAHDLSIALQGTWLRWEGLFTLCGYYVIFLAASLLRKKKYRNMIFLFFLGYSVIVAVFGLLQFLGIWLIVENAVWIACAPLQNPNMYASYAVLFAGVSMGGFVYYREENEFAHPFPFWNRIVWFVLSLLSFAACISALSSVAYVGIIMMFLLLLFIEIVGKTKRFLPIFCLILGLAATLFVLNLAGKGRVLNEFFSVGQQIAEEGDIFGDSVGTFRMEIYKNSIKLIPEYGLLGCGVEHFFYVYLKNFFLVSSGQLCDRAHNEYLNLWITEGILAIVSYLVFLFAVFVPSLVRAVKTAHREDSDVFRNLLFLAFFGYIAQAFFNNSTIQAAPYFWMFCGFLITMTGREKEEAVLSEEVTAAVEENDVVSEEAVLTEGITVAFEENEVVSKEAEETKEEV